MKKLGLTVILLMGFSTLAMAQDVPVAEVFGGYSFFRCDAGDDITCNLNGWNAAADFNFNNNWSAVIDVSGHYGYAENVPTPYGMMSWYDLKSHNFLFGPRYKMRFDERYTPFVHALIGINHVNPESYDGTVPPDLVQNNLAMAFGGGVDIKCTDRISVRAAQVDYLTTRVNSVFTDNLRFSAGVVFKFGAR